MEIKIYYSEKEITRNPQRILGFMINLAIIMDANPQTPWCAVLNQTLNNDVGIDSDEIDASHKVKWCAKEAILTNSVKTVDPLKKRISDFVRDSWYKNPNQTFGQLINDLFPDYENKLDYYGSLSDQDIVQLLGI